MYEGLGVAQGEVRAGVPILRGQSSRNLRSSFSLGPQLQTHSTCAFPDLPTLLT